MTQDNTILEERVHHLREAAAQVYGARPDLQSAFEDVDGYDYWAWVYFHGYLEVQALRDLLMDVPPPDVRRLVGTGDELGYLDTSASTMRMLGGLLSKQGRSFDEMKALFDFGCGVGRGLRNFLHLAGRVQCTGSDVDPAAIDWCQKTFPYGEFRVNQERPPLPFGEDSFDLIYAVSVFSHLSEQNHLEWLEELSRVSRPGSVLVLTIHGRHALERAERERGCLELLNVTRPELDQARHQMEERGFAFIPQPRGHLTTSLYGITLIDERYVKEEWGRVFNLLDHETAAIDDWQDAVVLTPRK